MKRMVKNGNLIDVEPDGTITVAGKPIGGGSSDKDLIINLDFSSTDQKTYPQYVTLPTNTITKINDNYYDSITFIYNDGKQAAKFFASNFFYSGDYSGALRGRYSGYYCLTSSDTSSMASKWYGKDYKALRRLKILVEVPYNQITISPDLPNYQIPVLDQAKFDALYKLADKPTQDGTYVLKATVSGGAVTYTWVAQ